MGAFEIIDANGNLKISPSGSGSGLTDPVTETHGGTNQTTYAQGDILYASAANTLSKLAFSSTGGIKVLTNTGSGSFDTPAWASPSTALSVLPRPTQRKWGALNVTAGSGATPYSMGFATVTGTLTTAVNDATSAWVRTTTAASAGSQGGIRMSNEWTRIQHLPRIETIIRTGSSVTDLRFFFFLSNVGGGFITNADDQHLLKGVGIRYSTVAGDAGFKAWTSDGTTQTVGSSNLGTVNASTVYTLSVVVTSNTSVTCTVGSTSETLTIGSGALSTSMRWTLELIATTNNAKVFDMKSMYGEWD